MEEPQTAKGALFWLFGRRGCWVIYATALMILLAGLWETKQSGYNIDRQMRRELVRKVADVAATVNPAGIRALSFSADDKNRPEFQRLCAQMKAYAEAAGLTSLYTTALRDGQIVFGPESLDEGSPYVSSPGTVYKRPTRKNFEVFKSGSPQIQGPVENEYGTFVSALAPVFDLRTGEVLAAVGIDVEASVWKSVIRRAQWTSAIGTLLLIFVLLLGGLTLDVIQRRSPERSGKLRHAETVLCAVFMILLTLVLTLHFRRAERETRENTFYSLAHAQAMACSEELYDLKRQVDRLGYFFESGRGGHVSREEFSAYCRQMVHDGSVQACIWLPEVSDAAAGSFVQSVRNTGLPDFSIWQRTADGRDEPSAARPVYYPMLYIEPQAGHEAAIGYDMNSEPACRVAIQESLSTGIVTATDPVRCGALTNSPESFIVFKQVNAADQKGLIAFIVHSKNLLGGALYKNQKALGLKVCLFQLQSGGSPVFLTGAFDLCDSYCMEDNSSGLDITVPVFRFGKTYAWRIIPDSSWLSVNPLRRSWITGCIGLLLTLLFCSVVALITNRRILLEKQVELRTGELRQAERNLLSLNRQNELILTSVAEGILGLDLHGTQTFVNPAALEMLGYEAEELIGRPIHNIWSYAGSDGNSYCEKECSICAAYKDGQVHSTSDGVFWRKDGTSFPVEYTSTPIYEQERLTGAVVTFSDITARKQAEARIHQLVQHLETVREEERRRLSRELHDDIGQILTALKIDLVVVKSECTCTGEVKDKMDDMQKLLGDGIQSIHSLCRRLRPGALDDLGLEDALEGLLDDWKQRNRVECTLCVDTAEEELPDEIKTAVFRLIQEALTNISRHAGASKVDITLVAGDRVLSLSVADNGCGMESGAANKPTSFGLLGMRERVEMLGGSFQIESTPGKGTRIEGTIPLTRNR